MARRWRGRGAAGPALPRRSHGHMGAPARRGPRGGGSAPAWPSPRRGAGMRERDGEQRNVVVAAAVSAAHVKPPCPWPRGTTGSFDLLPLALASRAPDALLGRVGTKVFSPDRLTQTAGNRFRFTGPVGPVTGGNRLNSNPNSNKFKSSRATGSDRFTGRYYRFTGRFDRFEFKSKFKSSRATGLPGGLTCLTGGP